MDLEWGGWPPLEEIETGVAVEVWDTPIKVPTRLGIAATLEANRNGEAQPEALDLEATLEEYV